MKYRVTIEKDEDGKMQCEDGTSPFALLSNRVFSASRDYIVRQLKNTELGILP